MQWYAVHTLSGQEKKVKLHIEKRLQATGLINKVGQLVIPSEEVAQVRKGKKTTFQKRVFPGYILIQMDLNDELWRVIRYTPGVFGIVGDSIAPTPLDEKDVSSIFNKLTTQVAKPKELFEKNETIRVIDGPFKDFIGTVEEIDLKHGKLKVMMNILGRSTPVELEVYQVEKL
jgi:transcriptional antiterminator NusG